MRLPEWQHQAWMYIVLVSYSTAIIAQLRHQYSYHLEATRTASDSSRSGEGTISFHWTIIIVDAHENNVHGNHIILSLYIVLTRPLNSACGLLQAIIPSSGCLHNNKVSGSLLHLMIMYMDCTGHSGLQFYCWFGMELRKVSVECTCQEFR